MRMRKCRLFWSICNMSSMMALNFEMSVSARVHRQLSNMSNIWMYHIEETRRKLCYIHRDCYWLCIELSGWKGSVTWSWGRLISRSLLVGHDSMVFEPQITKAITGRRCRGTSIGTTLWHRVTLGWFSKTTRTSLDDGARSANAQIWSN